MDAEQIVKKLRVVTSKHRPPCGRMSVEPWAALAAADLIESLQAQLAAKDAEIARLTKALHKADIDCDHCKHNHGGECENADFDCMTCACDCICRTCVDNSNWEWRGAEEEKP